MNTKTYRKYKVAKEGTYVFTRYGLEIPLSLKSDTLDTRTRLVVSYKKQTIQSQ